MRIKTIVPDVATICGKQTSLRDRTSSNSSRIELHTFRCKDCGLPAYTKRPVP